ncbi:MAG TPA: hypothetical protein DEO70_12185 [Bacteroidales bacterium]|nr:MAG: hypothetical protein A2X11_10175 [Bacteroidetes bacterium GWE2_42_24]OFY25877.1 MAG: hypothetical protein A2X09_09550 [Bacteroidetes bacterium GWF2_43_11]HBZ67587.1 hypothetical protein [Bacteroidales bacterium]
MEFSPEQLEELENLAGINYTIRQIALYFNVDYKLLLSFYSDEASWFRYHFDRGRLLTQAKVDMSTVQSAQGGNISAQQIFAKRRKEQEYTTLKEQLFGRHQ